MSQIYFNLPRFTAPSPTAVNRCAAVLYQPIVFQIEFLRFAGTLQYKNR